MNVPALVRETHWVCPNCDATDVTREPKPHSQIHECRGLFGLLVPMVPEGVRCKIEAHERDDYVNGEDVQLAANGRPYMSAVTTRDDGTDCTVYAPTARGGFA